MNRRAFLSGAFGLASLAALAAALPTAPPARRGARVSADPSDPGYDEWAGRAEVYLDGRRLLNCVTADEELGEVRCLSYSSWDRWREPEPRLQVLRGRVRVRYLPGHPKYRGDWVRAGGANQGRD